MSWHVRFYLVGETAGFTATQRKTLNQREAVKLAEQIGREGIWQTDFLFIPPSQIKSIYIYERK